MIDERARVAELHALVDPDTLDSEAVEELVVRAAELAGVPMATLNLLDAERQRQAAPSGFAGGTSPRSEAMCDITLREQRTVCVADARADQRFASNPWVDGRRGSVRFYAAVPLRTWSGAVVGTLCVFDTEPHELGVHQLHQLERLADEVVSILERERDARSGASA